MSSSLLKVENKVKTSNEKPNCIDSKKDESDLSKGTYSRKIKMGIKVPKKNNASLMEIEFNDSRF